MLVEGIRSDESIKILLLESDLSEQQSFALESILLSWLFDQDEFTVMQVSPTSFDLEKLNKVTKQDLKKIENEFVKKFKDCLNKTKEIDFADYIKIIEALNLKTIIFHIHKINYQD